MSEQGRHSHTDHDSSFITECPFKRRCIETSALTAQSESIGGVNNLKSGVTEYTDQLQSPGGLQKQRPDNASIIPVLPSANKNEKTSLGLGIQGEYDHLPKGEPRANEASPDYMAKFDEIILTYMKNQKIPGVSLVIGKGQDILYSQCYGWASHGVPVRSDHLFRIASISKVFTAVAVLKLYEDGKLRLTDRVFGSKGLLKQLKSGGGFLDRRVLKITVSHLLRHCGGWDRELAGDPCFWKHIGQEMGVEGPVDPSTLIVYMLERQKLQFNPGSRYAYSNFGYLVLGRVVEAVSGQNYGSYVQQILAQANIPGVKLGKTRKREADQREVEYFALPQHVSVESVFPGEGKVASPYGSYAMESGDSDGGWLSTPLHLLQLLQSIEGSRKPKILKPETFKSMLQRPRYAKGDTAWYGMGLDVAWNKKAWEHSGHIDGATGVLAHDRSGYMWSFLANYWPADSDYTSLMTYAVASTHRWSRPKLHRAIECNAATVDRKYSVQLSVPHADICSRLQSVQSQEYSLTWVNSYVVENTTYFNLVNTARTWISERSKKLLGYVQGRTVVYREFTTR